MRGEPGGDVHHLAVDVAEAGHHLPDRETDSQLGQGVDLGQPFDELECDLGAVHGLLGDEQHLIADRLHHPPVLATDHLGSHRLEPIDESGQLHRNQPTGGAGEPDHVGEPDDQRAGFALVGWVVSSRPAAAARCRQT